MRTLGNCSFLLLSIILMSYETFAFELTDKNTAPDGSQVLCESCYDDRDCERQGGSRCTGGICYTLEDKCLMNLSGIPIQAGCVKTSDCNRALCVNGVCTPCAADEKFRNGGCVKKAKGKQLGEKCDHHEQCRETTENSLCLDKCVCNQGLTRSGSECIEYFPKYLNVDLGGKCSNFLDCKVMTGVNCIGGTCKCMSGYKKKWSGNDCEKDYTYEEHYKPSFGSSDLYNPSYNPDPGSSSYNSDYNSSRDANILKVVGGVGILVVTAIALACLYMRRSAANARRRQAYQSAHPTADNNYSNGSAPMMTNGVTCSNPVQSFNNNSYSPSTVLSNGHQNNSDFTAYGPVPTSPNGYGAPPNNPVTNGSYTYNPNT